MFYKSIIYILLVALSFLLHSCANIVPIGGGPKDLKVPKLQKSVPENGQVNYANNTIDLYFNETVQVDGITEKLIISPLVDDNYSTLVKKNKVSLKFNKPFLPNTTYHFYFEECIKDVTEKNPVPEFGLCFSTGPYIDTLYIKGQIIDHEKQKPAVNIAIGLYELNDTLHIKNSKPLYYAKSNSQGNYQLKNLKAGLYKIYGLADANKNFMYDNEKESIAYKDSIDLRKSIEKMDLSLTRLDTKPPEIISDNSVNYYHSITFNETLVSASVFNGKDTLPSLLYESNKKLKVFNITKNTTDSISYIVNATDSAGNTSIENYKILYTEDTKKKKEIYSYNFQITPSNNQLSSKGKIILRFDSPINKINFDSILVKSDGKINALTISDVVVDKHDFTLTIPNSPAFKDSLILLISKGAFININNDSNSKSKIVFKKINEELYGSISGSIVSDKPSYIFQLLNAQNKVVKKENNNKKFEYKLLDPGTYKLRLIIDENANGKWDLLDLKTGRQPERVIYYKEPINLRANWDIEDIKFIVK